MRPRRELVTTMKTKNDIHGLLLLDKPIGISSNAALQKTKRLFNAKKAGHTGSLDPLATGMLPICFGEASKFTQFLLDADKTYETTAKLGVVTDSGDAEGQVIERREINDVSLEKINSVLEKFRGAQSQIPPMFSALKQQGKPLYELARAGISVPREPRKVIIHQLDLVDFSGDEMSLIVRCSKGTYIRSLVEDIGLALGCGAHVVVLRRTAVAGFDAEKMVTMDKLLDLSDAKKEKELIESLMPVDSLVSYLPAIQLNQHDTVAIKKGQSVKNGDPTNYGSESTLIRLYNSENQFIGLGELSPEGMLKPKRLLKT